MFHRTTSESHTVPFHLVPSHGFTRSIRACYKPRQAIYGFLRWWSMADLAISSLVHNPSRSLLCFLSLLLLGLALGCNGCPHRCRWVCACSSCKRQQPVSRLHGKGGCYAGHLVRPGSGRAGGHCTCAGAYMPISHMRRTSWALTVKLCVWPAYECSSNTLGLTTAKTPCIMPFHAKVLLSFTSTSLPHHHSYHPFTQKHVSQCCPPFSWNQTVVSGCGRSCQGTGLTDGDTCGYVPGGICHGAALAGSAAEGVAAGAE